MKRGLCLLLAMAFLAVLVSASAVCAADFEGKWQIEGSPTNHVLIKKGPKGSYKLSGFKEGQEKKGWDGYGYRKGEYLYGVSHYSYNQDGGYFSYRMDQGNPNRLTTEARQIGTFSQRGQPGVLVRE